MNIHEARARGADRGPQLGAVRYPRARSVPIVASDRPGGAGERRLGGRVASSGTVVVHGRSLAIPARILDVSLGGIRASVKSRIAPPLVGALVRLEVRLDGVGRWFHLSGRVERVEAGVEFNEIVVALDGVPPSFEDLVQDELLASIECAENPHVVLVDADRGRRRLVAAAFRANGFRTIEASSPLEAIADLDDSQLHPWAVVIADTEVDAYAGDLRRFLGRTYPGVPLLVIGADRCARSATVLCVDRIPDLTQQVLDLVRPWRAPLGRT